MNVIDNIKLDVLEFMKRHLSFLSSINDRLEQLGIHEADSLYPAIAMECRDIHALLLTYTKAIGDNNADE